MNKRVTVNGIDVGALRPMSEADRWGYYDGSMPTIMVFDILGVPHIVQYHLGFGCWCTPKYPRIHFHEDVLIGWLPAPKLEEVTNG